MKATYPKHSRNYPNINWRVAGAKTLFLVVHILKPALQAFTKVELSVA